MVNSHASPLPDGALAGVRDRALTSTSVPMALLDAAETNLPLIWVNDAFERVTGYGVEEAQRRQTAVLGDTVLQESDLVRLREGLRAGREITHTIVLRRADGTQLACRAHLSPVRADPDGPLTHWVAALQDLTEQLSHDAEQAARVGRLEGCVGHDLRLATACLVDAIARDPLERVVHPDHGQVRRRRIQQRHRHGSGAEGTVADVGQGAIGKG